METRIPNFHDFSNKFDCFDKKPKQANLQTRHFSLGISEKIELLFRESIWLKCLTRYYAWLWYGLKRKYRAVGRSESRKVRRGRGGK
jgi:hypothetical protein